MTTPPNTHSPAERAGGPFWSSRFSWLWIIGILVVLLGGAEAGGAAGLILAVALLGAAAALYTVVTGRVVWARVASRKAASLALVCCVVLTLFSGSLVGSRNAVDEAAGATAPAATEVVEPLASARQTTAPNATPDTVVSFTDEAAVDPEKATAADDLAAVAVADKTSTDATALAVLEGIPVKGRAPKTGYDRSGQFGAAWLDVDRNGCDTRNDILSRDLTEIVRSGPCTVLGGRLAEPFTGTAIDFVRGQATSALVQIDHLVSLSNAWQTGAQQLTQAQRISLANDPLNLLAVDGRANAQKGDGDAATWLPPVKSFRCEYVARQISVKATYGLWVTRAEHDAMVRVLSSCGEQRAVASEFTPDAAPVVVEPAPAPPIAEPAPAAPLDMYYQNCAAVRAAGAAPIRAGDPGYSRKLDRDGDGVGCE